MQLLKGFLWEICLYSLSEWREMREPPEPVSYFKIGLFKPVNSYKFEKGEIKYSCYGIYCFPFVFRWIKQNKNI